MQKLKTLGLALALFGLTGCETVLAPLLKPGTTPKIQEPLRTINRWIGRPTDRLVAEWGQPSKSYVDKFGKHYFVYETDAETRTKTKPQCDPNYKGHDGYYRDKSQCPEGAETATSYVVSCVYTFEVYNQTVINGSKSGDQCDVRK